MDEKEVRKLLHARSSPHLRRGRSCPDEIQLAAYVAQKLNAADKNVMERHLADCDYCLSQVGFLTQSADWPNSEEVPAQLLLGARKLVARKRSTFFNWDWRWAAASGAIACLAILVLVIVLQRRTSDSQTRPSDTLLAQQISPEPVLSPPIAVAPPQSRPEPTQLPAARSGKSTQAPDVRTTSSEALLPKWIAPRNGDIVRGQNLEFRWMPLADAIFYDVRIMTADGDVVFEKQSEDTVLKLDSAALLAPNRKYFAVVLAHLRQGKTAKSDVVGFSIAQQ